jgi:hypothetical protein
MAYTITKTNGDTLVTVPETELNTDYGITLVGRNYAGYGIYLNDNFVSLMENFANPTAPAQPLEGQLWWNSTENSLQIWQGSVWKKIGHVTASSIVPSSLGRAVGDQWWDTTNQQLKVWAGETISNSAAQLSSTQYVVSVANTDNVRIGDVLTTGNISNVSGILVTQVLSSSNVRISSPATIFAGETVTFTRGSGWNLVGPSYTKDQQLTGIFPRSITDLQGTSRVVGLIYQKGQVIGSISRDNEYTPNSASAIDRLPIIKPGITLIEDSAPQEVRSVVANAAGAGGSTVIALSNTTGLQVGDRIIAANIAYAADKSIQEIYANSSIRINATDFFSTNEVVVFQRGADQSNLFNGTATNSQRLNGFTSDRFAILSTDQFFTANVGVAGNIFVGSDSAVQRTIIGQSGSNLNITNTQANGNIVIQTVVAGIGTPATVLAIDGVSGLATVRGVPTLANGIATKSYVDGRETFVTASLVSNVTALINSAPVDKRDFGNVATILNAYANTFVTVDNQLASKANINAPVFTGVPEAPTASAGTATTQIATTAFVTTAVTNFATLINANVSAANTAIATRAPSVNADLAGTPQAAEVATSDRSRRIATTKFVGNVVDAALNSISGTLNGAAPALNAELTGTPTAPSGANVSYTIDSFWSATKNLSVTVSGNPSRLATVGFVANAIASMPYPNLTTYATLASPNLTGVPIAPTAALGTATDQIATTKFVTERSPVLRVAGYTGNVELSVSDITGAAPIVAANLQAPVLSVIPSSASNDNSIPSTSWVKAITSNLAPLSSPTFIGTVSVPTPTDGSNTTVAASTAWVRARIATADVPKWGGSTKYVDTRAPLAGEGNNGDIWFKYIL